MLLACGRFLRQLTPAKFVAFKGSPKDLWERVCMLQKLTWTWPRGVGFLALRQVAGTIDTSIVVSGPAAL